MQALGLPGWELLKSPDPLERIAASALADEVEARREDERDELAMAVVKYLAEAVNRK